MFTQKFIDKIEKEWFEKFLRLINLTSDYMDEVLLSLIEKNLDKDWNWEMVSSHLNLNMDIIEENPDKDWSWANLLVHPNITLGFASAHLDKD